MRHPRVVNFFILYKIIDILHNKIIHPPYIVVDVIGLDFIQIYLSEIPSVIKLKPVGNSLASRSERHWLV